MYAQESRIEGMVLQKNIITPEEEQNLIESILAGTWNTSLKRRTQHYGFEYSYDRKSVATKTQKMPQWCFVVKERLQKLIRENEIEQDYIFDQMIVNEYQPGQGINPHIDNTSLFMDIVASVSLGSECVMVFERKENEKVEVLLNRRSAILLHGPARYEWKHSIPSRKKDHGVARSVRYSMTFRKMKNHDL